VDDTRRSCPPCEI